jgi:hypothetical protein
MSGLLHDHINTVMRHYAGQVFAWDVVNEGLDENGRLKDSPWYNRPGIGMSEQGTAYIEQAFRWAHEADPHALLFYNENGGEGRNRKSDAIYAMVKAFKQRGVPIDGVGLQMHISHLDLDTAPLAANIARLTALGLQVHITELAHRYRWTPVGWRAPTHFFVRLKSIARLFGRACKVLPARRFSFGDSPTSTLGLGRILTGRGVRRSPSTARTSQKPLTKPCSKRSPPKNPNLIKSRSLDPLGYS